MLINPIEAIEKKWIVHPDCKTLEDWKEKEFLSPNAIDFTLDNISQITSLDFLVNEKNKSHRDTVEMNTTLTRDGIEHWGLYKGCFYDGMSDMYVELPQGIAATLVTRSTFNRNAVFISSGLYDSGFQGNIGFVIYNLLGTTYIGEHTRIGQIIFHSSDSGELYKGGYNTEMGKHWKEVGDNNE